MRDYCDDEKNWTYYFDRLTRFDAQSRIIRSRDSLVGIATGYGLDERGGGSSSPGRVKKSSLLHIVQTGSGVHPTSYKMGTGGEAAGA
jgi:hypothetical protein